MDLHPEAHEKILTVQETALNPDANQESYRSLQDVHNVSSLVSGSHFAQEKSFFSRWQDVIVISSFLATFLLIIAALVLAFHHSQTTHGFSVSTSLSPYCWKFGPTALFVLIVSLWRQVDYRIKRRAPWRQMAEESAPADKTVLLDYISPIIFTTVVTALRNKHWEVAISNTVFALLKLAVFFSTGLLALQETHMESRTLNLPLLVNPGSGPNATDFVAMYEVVLDYVGARGRGSTWPRGTSPDAAYQRLAITDNATIANSVVSADVLAFYPQFDCRPAATDISFNVSHDHLHGPSVSKRDEARYLWLNVGVDGHVPIAFSEMACTLTDLTCPELFYAMTFNLAYVSDWDNSNDKELNAFHVAIVAMKSEVHPEVQPVNLTDWHPLTTSILQGSGWTQSVSWSSGLVCRPQYKIETGLLVVEHDASANVISESVSSPITHTGQTLPFYTYGNLTQDLYLLLQQAASYEVQTLPSTGIADSSAGIVKQMLYEADTRDLEYFKNVTNMVDPANRVLKGLTSAWAGSWLSFPDHTSTTAIVTQQRIRLLVSKTSTWAIVVVMAVSILLLAFLLKLHKVRIFGLPENVLEEALLLNQSHDFASLIKSSGKATNDDLKHQLASRKFWISKRTAFGLKIETDGFDNGNAHSELQHLTTQDAAKRHTSLSYWKPIPSRYWFISITIISTITAIAALELISRIASNGLNLSVSRNLSSDIAAFIPALLLLSLAMLFSVMEFGVAQLSPYLLLRNATISSALKSQALGQIPPHAIFRQLKSRQYGTSSVMLASLLGSILTILGSALYTIQPATSTRSVKAITIDQFNVSAVITAKADSTSLIPSISTVFAFLELRNLSFPSGTYDELVYPTFKLEDLILQNSSGWLNGDSHSVVEIELPAMRASLDCTVLANSDIQLYGFDIDKFEVGDYPNITSVLPLSEYCMGLPLYADSSSYHIGDKITDKSFPAGKNHKTISSVDRISKIFTNNGSLAYFDDYTTSIDWNCPTVAFTIGTYYFGQTEVNSDTTRLVCGETLQEIPTTFRFHANNLTMDLSSPPVLHEDRAKRLPGPRKMFPSIWEYDCFNEGQRDRTNADTSIYLDCFFDAIVHGIDGVPLTEIMGPDNHEQLFNAIQHIYRQYMAQAISIAFRTSSGNYSSDISELATPLGTTIEAIMHDHDQLRIVQNHIPKILLQAVLGTMLMFLLAGIPTLRQTGKLLPHNPSSVTGSMSFLAGGGATNLAAVMEAQNATDRKTFSQLRLKLGWWEPNAFEENLRQAVRNDVDETVAHLSPNRNTVVQSANEDVAKGERSTPVVVEVNTGPDTRVQASRKWFGINVVDNDAVISRQGFHLLKLFK